jgi:hypothetical protein
MSTPATHTWQPTTTRVVVVEGFGPYPRGVLQTQPPPLVWPVKDPADILDYVVDLSDALAGNDGDTIATLDVSISPSNTGDLTLQSSSADGDQAILWLASGVSGTTYAVTVVVGTNSGRVISRVVSLPVESLSTTGTGASSGAALTDQTGAPITDQTGAAITVSN